MHGSRSSRRLRPLTFMATLSVVAAGCAILIPNGWPWPWLSSAWAGLTLAAATWMNQRAEPLPATARRPVLAGSGALRAWRG
jgi:hypothetical protein